MAPLKEREVQAKGDGVGFTTGILQALFPEVLFPNFCTSTGTPATRGVRTCPESPVVGSLTR